MTRIWNNVVICDHLCSQDILAESEVGKGQWRPSNPHPARSRVLVGLRISEGGGASASQGRLCQGMAICTVNCPISEITWDGSCSAFFGKSRVSIFFYLHWCTAEQDQAYTQITMMYLHQTVYMESLKALTHRPSRLFKDHMKKQYL